MRGLIFPQIQRLKKETEEFSKPFSLSGPGILQPIAFFRDVDNVKYKIEEYSNAKDLVQAIQDGKCPVLVAENRTKSLVHAMVAYSDTKIGNIQYVKCKNSYGQNPLEPGNFHNRFQISR